MPNRCASLRRVRPSRRRTSPRRCRAWYGTWRSTRRRGFRNRRGPRNEFSTQTDRPRGGFRQRSGGCGVIGCDVHDRLLPCSRRRKRSPTMVEQGRQLRSGRGSRVRRGSGADELSGQVCVGRMSSYHAPLRFVARSFRSKPQPRDTSVCRSVDFSRPHAWNRWSHEYVEGPSRSRCCRQMIRLLPAELSRHNAIAVPLPTIQRLRPSALRNVLAAMNLRPAGNPRSRPIAGLGADGAASFCNTAASSPGLPSFSMLAPRSARS